MQRVLSRFSTVTLLIAIGIPGLGCGTNLKSGKPEKKEAPMSAQNTLDIQPGSVLHGFRYLKAETVKEADATARLFEHVKTGARLMYLSSKDDNKVFSIAFRTPPADSTGLPHILEHSVLNGSRKFPSKEPFVELLKGSVNTFVNAMTFPDKTVYPVASRNDKDFRNLMDVYLDAVFYPRLTSTPEVLQQEGWHHEIDPKTGELSFNGVVYNEMKGVYSSPEGLLGRESFRSLYPDTLYSHDSGGDPHDIPNLTQEAFVNFYKKYYHPSNSYVFIYGNGDIAQDLAFLDSEYLSHFDAQPASHAQSKIGKQKPFAKPRELSELYPVNPGESIQDKTFFTLNYAVGTATDAENVLAMEILEYILLESQASPLKRALLDAKIGKSASGEWETDILQPSFTIKIKGSNVDQKAKFAEVVDKTLRSLVKDGINPKLVEASINREEFLLREFEVRGYPKGLVYNFKVLESWLYEGDPLLHLRFEAVLAKIKKAAGQRYFENLIEKNLLKNQHRTMISLAPKAGLDQQKSEELRAELAAFKAKKTPAQLADIQAKAAALKQRQEAPDSPEDLAKIPLLAIQDLNPKAERLPLKETELAGVKVLQHPQFTNGIAYLNLYFDTTAVPEELIPYLPLLATVLGKVGTQNHDFQDLSNEINLHTGGISFGHKAFPDKDSTDVYSPRFLVKAKALVGKLPKLTQLVQDILIQSKFNDPKRLKEILQETKSRLETGIPGSGMDFAMTRVGSYFSTGGKYNELTGGITYYHFIAALEKSFSAKTEAAAAQELAERLAKVAKLVFNRHQLMISLASEESDYTASHGELKKFIDGFPAEKLTRQNYGFKLQPTPENRNEGLIIPSKVQYVAQAADFRKLGFSYTGRLQVLSKILRTDYLWNRVRVQGGAYGAVIDSGRNGTLVLASYRDPNLKRTLDTYAKTSEYLEKFAVPEREMTKFIIGTVSSLDRPLTPSEKGEVATSYYLSRVSYDDIQKAREEVLSTRVEDIRTLGKLFEKAMQQNYVCVVGGDTKIQEDKAVLGKLVNVFE